MAFLVAGSLKFQPFLPRPQGHHVRHTFQQAAQAEGDALEFQTVGLDLRQVQQVVDQFQQGVGAVLQGLYQFALGFRELFVAAEDVGDPDDDVHRRTDLVAHIRQEFRFGDVGCLRGVARLDQLAFEALGGHHILLALEYDAGGAGKDFHQPSFVDAGSGRAIVVQGERAEHLTGHRQ